MVKVALLIGVSEYEPGLNPLPAAVRDVEAMRQVLVNPEIGGFAETDIVVLKNPERQEMEETIEHLFAHRQRDDLLVLFFSGHGITDDTGKFYLATRITRKTPRGDLILSSAVAASFVHENMSRSRSKRQVIILDCCFSGAFAKGMSAKDDGSVNIREQLGGEGRAVLTSSSSTQYSFAQEGSELSTYTRYLIEGITTITNSKEITLGNQKLPANSTWLVEQAPSNPSNSQESLVKLRLCPSQYSQLLSQSQKIIQVKLAQLQRLDFSVLQPNETNTCKILPLLPES